MRGMRGEWGQRARLYWGRDPYSLREWLRWRKDDPDKREIRMVIGTEVGWTQVLAVRPGELATLVILENNNVPLTIGEYDLTLRSMDELWNTTIKKIATLRKQSAWSGPNEFYHQMPTVKDAENFLGVTLS